jgi:carbon monoxide dehydrogenase subunit G
MTTFNSNEKEIRASRKQVYEFVSDINNFTALVPGDKVRNFETERDKCRFTVDGLGRVGVSIVSREPESRILFESEGEVPFDFTVQVDLREAGAGNTIMKILLNADLNMMMKAVARKPLTEGVEVIASELAGHLNRLEWDKT